MSTAPARKYTIAEYLALERACDYKSQYFAGEIFAMAGGSRRHSKIAVNVITALEVQLKTTPCSVYNSDLKVMVQATGLITYPDITVSCGAEEFLDQEEDVLLNPTVIVEVLSPSTESYDRGKKSENYRKLPSLRQYLLVAQDRIHIELFSRQANSQWSFSEVDQPGQSLSLDSIGCRLTVDDVYAKIAFEDEEATQS